MLPTEPLHPTIPLPDLLKEVARHILGEIGFYSERSEDYPFFLMCGAYHTHGHVFRDKVSCGNTVFCISAAKNDIATTIAKQLLNTQRS